MKWKGKELATKGDAVDALAALESREEAQEFLAQCRAEGDKADDNVGYLIGYMSSIERGRLYAWMEISHPIFGDRDVTAKEAFEMGMAAAAKDDGR